MMAHQHLLHELLREDQEPFHLKSYIADRRSQLNKTCPITTLQLRKQKPVVPETAAKAASLCTHVCFFSFNESPVVRKSPFLDFSSPALSPCKSPAATVLLQVPSRTAALLVEAATRIQKHQRTKPKAQVKSVGFGLFGSFLKRLKDRSKNKKLAMGDNEPEARGNYEPKSKEEMKGGVKFSSCSCNKSTLSRGDLDSPTMSCRSEESEVINGHLALREMLSWSSPVSPFRFSLQKSPSFPGRRTPDFSSPVASPSRQVEQEKANYQTQNSGNLQGEETEQCSPVSVLDSFFEDNEHGSGEAVGEDNDIESSYANVQRVKQQLLYRLRRFEKLADMDPMELDKKLLEGYSDEEYRVEGLESDAEKPMAPCRKQGVEPQVFNLSGLQHNSWDMPADMKKQVSDLAVEDKNKTKCPGDKEVIWGRIRKRWESWKEVEFVDMMVELDFRGECDGWKKFPEQVEETAAEVELAIVGVLVDELSQELLCMDEQHQELNWNAHDSSTLVHYEVI